MFDVARPCRRCGLPDSVTDAAHDVCDYCQHLDHATTNHGCHWCRQADTGTEAGKAAANAAANADPVFMDAALDALATVRRRGDDFIAADVREVLTARGVTITRPAALGSVFGTMHALGLIKPTGEFRPSPVKAQHGRPLRVWRAA